MGFDCQLLGLRLVQPKLYVIEEIGAFSFPISKKHIKEGAIEDMVNILTFARDHDLKMKKQINELEREKTLNKITKVLPSHTWTTVAVADWCSDVIWHSYKNIQTLWTMKK